jgi:hypothetical protein
VKKRAAVLLSLICILTTFTWDYISLLRLVPGSAVGSMACRPSRLASSSFPGRPRLRWYLHMAVYYTYTNWPRTHQPTTNMHMLASPSLPNFAGGGHHAPKANVNICFALVRMLETLKSAVLHSATLLRPSFSLQHSRVL